jgi:antitoxin MazE
MKAIIQKWGNSQGVRLPKSVLEEAMFRPNEEVDIVAEENKIIIKKQRAKDISRWKSAC